VDNTCEVCGCKVDPRMDFVGCDVMGTRHCNELRCVGELKARLAASEARVAELTKQLSLRCRAEMCDKEELLAENIDLRTKLATAEAEIKALTRDRNVQRAVYQQMLRDEERLQKRLRAEEQERDSAVQRLSSAEARIESDYKQACYLRSCVSPQCTSLNDTSGVLSQLSNFMAGQRDDLAAANSRNYDLRQLLETVCEAWECGHLSSVIAMQRLYLTREWYDMASKLTTEPSGNPEQLEED
jgi:chromosome segregation ATPase